MMQGIKSYIFQCLDSNFARVDWTYLSDKFQISLRQILHKYLPTIGYLLVNLQLKTNLQTQILTVFQHLSGSSDVAIGHETQ